MMETAVQAGPSNVRERLRVFIEHRRVQGVIIALILINAALLGLETWHVAMAAAGGLILAVDRATLSVFVAEIVLRLYVPAGLLARFLERVRFRRRRHRVLAGDRPARRSAGVARAAALDHGAVDAGDPLEAGGMMGKRAAGPARSAIHAWCKRRMRLPNSLCASEFGLAAPISRWGRVTG